MTDKAYIETVDIEFHIAEDAEDFAESVARSFVRLAQDCIQKRGRFVVALSGGSTPAAVMDVLATKYKYDCDWERIHFFWSDERVVPPDHQRSNFNMARIHLLDKVNVPSANIHRMEASNFYINDFSKMFADKKNPEFDLILLGLGEDGHTASLFPHHEILNESERPVAEVFISGQKEARITFTYPVINRAQNIFVLISGEAKEKIVQTSLMNPPDPQALPIQGIQPLNGKLVWFLDRAAAESLRSQSLSYQKIDFQ
jgi:6-phosphogluconolactonase